MTLEQGSRDSSLAATRATQPSVTLFRYTMGVLPMTSLRREGQECGAAAEHGVSLASGVMGGE